MDELEFWITEAFIVYGGSFVKSLGELYRIADSNNKRKLRAAFGHYFDEYTKKAKELWREDQLKEGGDMV